MSGYALIKKHKGARAKQSVRRKRPAIVFFVGVEHFIDAIWFLFQLYVRWFAVCFC